MKTAVIGVGNMGRHHARVYKELDTLVGVCDANEQQVKKIASIHGVLGTTNIEHLLQLKPDYVTIAVPTSLHKKIATKCLRSGCHVLLEKPMAGNLKDAEAILDTANKEGMFLVVGYIERFNPAFTELKKRVDDGCYGELTSINIKRVGGSPQSADNIIVDVMTHDLNLLTALFNKPPRGLYVFQSSSHGKVNSAQALLQFGDASATCESNWVSPVKMRTVAITGEGGHAEVNMMKQTITEFKNNHTVIDTYPGEPLKLEIENFLQNKGISPEDALQTLDITLRAAKICL